MSVTIYDPLEVLDYIGNVRKRVSFLKTRLIDKSITKEEIKELEEKLSILERFELDYKNNRYKYYVPIAKLDPFIAAVGSPEYFMTLLSSGNAIGKTTTSIVLLAQLIWFSGNKYFDYPLFKSWHYPKFIRIVSETSVVENKIIPSIREWFPKGRWRGTKGGKRFISRITTDNGWTIDFMTYGQEKGDITGKFEGVDLGLFWCDEPPPYAIYSGLIARLRPMGKGFITATPVTRHATWFMHAFFKNEKSQFIKRIEDVEIKEDTNYIGSKIAVIDGIGMEDACKEHGERGFLPHQQIENMKASFPPDEVPARVYGKMGVATSRLVFPEFNERIHVIKPFEITPEDHTIYCALDPHDREPDAVMWAAIDRDGNVYVVNELFETTSIEDLVNGIKRIEAENNYRVVLRLIDPRYTAPSIKTAGVEALSDILRRDYGLLFIPASKNRRLGIQLIHQYLNYKIEHDEKSGADVLVKPPKLYFFQNVNRTIWEIKHWHKRNPTTREKELGIVPDEPVDADDHMMENLGRILLARPTFISTTGFSSVYHWEQQYKRPGQRLVRRYIK